MRFVFLLMMWFISHTVVGQTALTVSVVSPQYRAVDDVVRATGYLEPRNEAVVNARLNGTTLEKIDVELGDWVKKGQVLARFDAALIRHDITRAEAMVAQAQIGLKQSRDNAKRAAKLLNADAMSRIEGERYLSAELDAQAGLNAAKAQLESSRLQLSYTEVKAPIGGIISDKQAVLGATANVGMPLFRIIADGELTWRAQVAQDKMAGIAKGTSAWIRLPSGEPVHGEVYNIAPTVNPQSREVTVFVSVAANQVLRSGMLVSGELLLGAQDKMLIPASTVQPSDGRNYVWLISAENTAHRQEVQLGRQVGAMIEVREGLRRDSRIVERGGGFLAEGDKVRVVANPNGTQ